MANIQMSRCQHCNNRFPVVDMDGDTCATCQREMHDEAFLRTCHKCKRQFYATRMNGRRGKREVCYSCVPQPIEYTDIEKYVEAQNIRAAFAGNPSTLTVQEWKQTLTDFNHRCAYCGEPAYGMDHFVPVALGGGTIATNCVPACRLCNSQKLDVHPYQLRRISWPARIHRVETYLVARMLKIDCEVA